MRRLRPLLLPTLSGVLYFLSWIGFGVWPLAFVCFVPLLWSLRDATPRQALGRGAWMGFVTHLGGYTWIMHLLGVFAYAPLPLAFLGYLALCAAQGLLFGVVALLVRWAWLRTGFRLAALLPLGLAAAEHVYPLLFQSYTGVALMPVLPLVQIADLGGPLLLGSLVALVNGAFFDAALAYYERRAPPTRALAASLIGLAASGAYGFYRIVQLDALQREAPHVRTGLAQPNVGEQELHRAPQLSVRTLWSQTAELQTRGADLVIWPEVGFNTRPVSVRERDGRAIQGNVPVALIAGVERVSETDAWNSAILIDPKGRIGDHYDKIRLLAFGEYIPGGDWFPALYRYTPLASHLTRGQTTAPLHWDQWRFATFICYEGILPGLVRETMKDTGEGRPHALVNLTNDSWYGAGHEQEQHLMLAAIRSIEHRRWLLRATSTGISAFVDATGRVVQTIARNERGVAVQDVPMLQGTTVYEVLGDWPGWLALVVLAAIAWRTRKARTAAVRPKV